MRTTKTGKTVRVKRTWVPRSRYKTVDRGAPGRTPVSKRWFKPMGKLYGWTKDGSVSARREALGKSVRHDGYATTVRRLNALRNVSTDRKTDRVAKEDMNWLKRRYR